MPMTFVSYILWLSKVGGRGGMVPKGSECAKEWKSHLPNLFRGSSYITFRYHMDMLKSYS